jgi:hypothetical protein
MDNVQSNSQVDYDIPHFLPADWRNVAHLNRVQAPTWGAIIKRLVVTG